MTTAQTSTIEQAKGVLMLRYGVGSYEAFAILVRWSQDAGVALPLIALALTSGICQGRDDARVGHPQLTRWLEQQLRRELTAPPRTRARPQQPEFPQPHEAGSSSLPSRTARDTSRTLE